MVDMDIMGEFIMMKDMCIMGYGHHEGCEHHKGCGHYGEFGILSAVYIYGLWAL